MSDWDESEHPRHPRGSDRGGEFRRRGPATFPQLWRIVSPSSGTGGAFYGTGTYFSTDFSHAQATLEGYRDYVDSDAKMMRGRAWVRKPFQVDATNTGGMLPGDVMHQALRRAGIAGPAERLQPQEITRRLREAGYDSVQVNQPGPINDQVGGSQLLVFDPADAEVVEAGEVGGWAAQVAGALARHTRRRGPSREQLQAGLESGLARPLDKVHGGASARTRSGKFNSGTLVMVKDAKGAEGARMADAEYLAGLVGEAVNAPVPAVLRRDGNAALIGYVPAMSAPQIRTTERDRRQAGQPTLLEEALATDDGIMLGLMDVLTANHDRNPGNYLFAGDGTFTGIDHGWAFDYESIYLNDVDDETVPFWMMRNPVILGTGFVRRPRGIAGKFANTGEWTDNPISPDDMAVIGQRLQALRPEFERLGWLGWHDGMMRRHRILSAHATGTRSRL